MQEIKDDLKAIRADVGAIKVNIAINTESLKAHMERTRLNEQRVEKLEYLFIGIAAVGVLGGLVKVLLTVSL